MDNLGENWFIDGNGSLNCKVALKNLNFYGASDGVDFWFCVFDEGGEEIYEYSHWATLEIGESYIKFYPDANLIQLIVREEFMNTTNLTERFLAFRLNEKIEGNVTIIRNWGDVVYNKNFAAILSPYPRCYMVEIGDNGTFIFENATDGNHITIAVTDENGNELIHKNYIYLLENNTFRLEEDMDESDVNIDVTDIDPEESDETFASISLPKKAGSFIICLLNDQDVVLYAENLAASDKVYEDDGEFTLDVLLDDVNEFISRNNISGAKSLKELIDSGKINDQDVILFMHVYGGELFAFERYVITTETPDGMILFDEFETAQAEYGNLEIIMDDDYKNDVIAIITVKDEYDATVVIKLNGKTVYEQKLNYKDGILTPENCSQFFIALDNLTGDLEAGEYEMYVAIYDGDELQWDNEDEQPFLVLYEQQMVKNENTTIEIIPVGTLMDENDMLITIKTNNATGDVVIFMDDSEIPVIIPLSDARHDENTDTYIIGSKELGLAYAGDYKLNVTYDNVNIIGNISSTSNLDIEIRDCDGIIYTGEYGDNTEIAAFRFVDGEINSTNVNGTVKVLVYLDGETPTLCLEKDIKDLVFDENMRTIIIPVNELENVGEGLNGTYKVAIIYEGGSEAPITAESEITFKIFGADDFGIKITDTEVTFENYPEIGGELIWVIDWLKWPVSMDSLREEGTYSIPLNVFPFISDGKPHNFSFVFKTKDGKELLLANKVINPADPALKIAVANIEEGASANVTITADANFSGIVVVKIGTASYNVSVVNGSGSLAIPNLAAGTYIATATSAESGLFANATATTTFTVTKKAAPAPAKDTVKLTLKKVKVKRSAKKLVLKATLKINGKAKKVLRLNLSSTRKPTLQKPTRKVLQKSPLKRKS